MRKKLKPCIVNLSKKVHCYFLDATKGIVSIHDQTKERYINLDIKTINIILDN